MTSRPPNPVVVLLSGPGTLEEIDRLLSASKVRLHRVEVLRQTTVPAERWLPRVRRARAVDTVLVTSPFTVAAGVLPWRRTWSRNAPRPEFWAAGPRTAERLHALGIRPVRRGTVLGAKGIVVRLGDRPRKILYLRSDLAGTALARTLRARGHRVTDVAVYHVETSPTLTERDRQRIGSATVLAATSPSAITGLRRGLGIRGLRTVSESTPMVVLGQRSARAARALGFRRVSVAPRTSAQGFTRFLLREVGHATS
jgi:uroporphyrinogen-III synthase